MTRSRHIYHRRAAPGISQRLLSAVTDMIAGIENMFERSRQRRALERLDDRLLQDIGLPAETVRHEVQRPFWR